jgi:predicted dienelactone hydrolase
MMLELGNGETFTETQLKEINVPVVLSIGSKDHMVSIDETAHISSLLPNARLLVLEDWTHPVEKLDTARIKQELSDFFNA